MKNRTTTSKTSYELRGGSQIQFLVILCIASFIVIAVNSCTSRKAEKQRQVEVLNTKTFVDEHLDENKEINVKVQTTTDVDDKTETEKIVKLWSPIDPTLPSSMTDPDGKKRDFTNSSYKEEVTKVKKNTKNAATVKAEISEKQAVIKDLEILQKSNKESSAETINITKKGISFGFWVWISIGIIVAIGLLYLNHRFNLIKRVTSKFSK